MQNSEPAVCNCFLSAAHGICRALTTLLYLNFWFRHNKVIFAQIVKWVNDLQYGSNIIIIAIVAQKLYIC